MLFVHSSGLMKLPLIGSIYPRASSLVGMLTVLVPAGALFLISSWYKRDEMTPRSAIFFYVTQLGSAFSGIIGAGVQHSLDGARGMPAWGWLFIDLHQCFQRSLLPASPSRLAARPRAG